LIEDHFQLEMNTAISSVIRPSHILRRGAVGLAGFLAVAAVFAEGLLFSNPLVEQRADPWVHLHTDGYYYLIATVPEYDRIELRRARTLEGLRTAVPKDIWTKYDSGPMSHHIWAPELHRIDDKWYVHFAAGRAEAIWDIRMYVLENASANPLEGEWIEKGQIKTRWETFSLDATTFEHRGVRYLVWAQKDPDIKGNTNLYIARMDTPWSIVQPQVMLTKPEYDWEQIGYWVNEGAAVLIRNGRVFITYSASATDSNYCMGLLTADADSNLLDPNSWTKSPRPVFATWSVTGQYGPGHNSFTTTPDGTTDIMVYHARNYRRIEGEALRDPNRHTRAQVLEWNSDGTPNFGVPVPDGPLPQPLADKPLFRDPVYDGAADPVVIWNPERKRWWMFYTNRRANAPGLSGVSWVHGTRIGIAESVNGASWAYVGTADIDLPVSIGGNEPTHWAPDVITAPDGTHHMFLTVVPGVFNTWNHPRRLVQLTSTDLRHWRNPRALDLASDRVIDAAVLQLADGSWRMWYNNERDNKSIYHADSPDLVTWIDRGKAVGDQGGEGPKVFHWHDTYWMITDVWDGLAVYRSEDALRWSRQPGGNLLQQPGRAADDAVKGGHADVLVNRDRAFLFYFTHPGRTGPDAGADGYEQRRSSIQVVELFHRDGRLTCDRDAPTHIRLIAPRDMGIAAQ
jgi:GH43 family beta-xylosidase